MRHHTHRRQSHWNEPTLTLLSIACELAEVSLAIALLVHGMTTDPCHFAIIALILSSTVTLADRSRSASAVCFLTAIPSPQTIRFARQLAHSTSSFDVFILVDNNTFAAPVDDSTAVRFLQFNDTVCSEHGFWRSGAFGINKDCSAWDKALFFFAKVSVHHGFVWFIEEDVFIPSVQSLLSLHELYSPSTDLVANGIEYNFDGRMGSWYHWPLALNKFPPPWMHSMVCAMGCSRRLLSAVDEYARWRGELVFIEILLPTLTLQSRQMQFVTALELSKLAFRLNHQWEQIRREPYNWWHPVKDQKQHEEWRDRSVDRRIIIS